MSFTKIVTLNIALYVFLTLNPYIKWILPNELFYGFFLFSFVVLNYMMAHKNQRAPILTKNKLPIFIALVLFIVYYTTPIIHVWRFGHLFWMVPFLFILSYKNEYIIESYRYFKKIMVFVAAFSLVFWLFHFFNVPIPYYSYHPDFRYNPSDYYRIYGVTISLFRESRAIGEIYGFERITGVFAEPGHYGIFLGVLLAIEKFNFTKRDNQILLITGILTFSTAFYGIFFLGFFYRLITERKLSKNLLYPTISLFLIITLGFLLAGSVFNELFLGDLLQGRGTLGIDVLGMIDSRVSNRFIDDFQFFTNTGDFLTGIGYATADYVTTNWRGLVFRFGIIGLFVMVFFIYSIVRGAGFLYGLLLFSIAMLILAHRSYLLYTPGIYLMLYYAITLNQYRRID